MDANEERLRRQLVEVARHAEALGLIQHAQGNFSARIPGRDHVLITPSAMPYRELGPSDIVTVDLAGNVVHGIHPPSTEVAVHTMCYRRRPEVGGCAHVEPPYLNTLYVVDRPIPNLLGNFVYLFEGRGLAVVPAMVSGNEDFAKAAVAALEGYLGVVWKNHGLFCVGADVRAAFDRCVAAEQAARVHYQALALARQPDLIPETVQVAMVETVRRRGRAI
jgi:L-ribulose-5-phosphate 4-epimerase